MTRHHTRRLHRRNPPHDSGKLIAFGLLGVGVFFLLNRPSNAPAQPYPSTPYSGILGPIAQVGSWFQNIFAGSPSSATAGPWSGAWPDTSTPPVNSQIMCIRAPCGPFDNTNEVQGP